MENLNKETIFVLCRGGSALCKTRNEWLEWCRKRTNNPEELFRNMVITGELLEVLETVKNGEENIYIFRNENGKKWDEMYTFYCDKSEHNGIGSYGQVVKRIHKYMEE